MSKENIVRKNWEFQKILNSKKQIVTKHVILYYLKSDVFKIGISIPKQFVNAVNRNYNRNQIRAILRSLELKDIHYETVLIARKTFFDLDYQQKHQEIKKNIWKDENVKWLKHQSLNTMMSLK